MSDDQVPTPPEGFEPSARGPYTTHNGPMFHLNRADGSYEHAFFVLPRHCNGMGFAHAHDKVTWLVVLQHAPHGFDIVTGKAPVAL